ncbi:MAG: PHP domain-containing protein [Ruminococcaceae bacterium]|nr:PHP domain-containing protein [Oscillospiraceae bacterium]
MKRCLLPENGTFYKANMHTHTNISDGVFSPEEIKKMYSEAGYSIVAFTDHEVMVPQNHLTDDRFLAINGVETITSDKWPGGYCYNKTYHINFYAKTPDITYCPVLNAKNIWQEHTKAYATPEMIEHPYKNHYSIAGVNDAIQKATAAGFLVCLNHPVWSSQDYSDYVGLKGLWGVEVYNTGCYRGGQHDTAQPMVDMLRTNERVMPVAADDTHAAKDTFGGWLMVKADRLEYKTVMDALERGDFYASTGPEIKALYLEDGVLKIETSEAVSISLIASYRYHRTCHGTPEAPLSGAAFDLNEFMKQNNAHENPRCTPCVRLEVRDRHGNFAWTRAFFLDELNEKGE